MPLLCGILLSGAGLQQAHAASATWSVSATNGNWFPGAGVANWSTGANTSPGATSGTTSANIATFNNASAVTSIVINTSTGTLNVAGITFDTAASAYTIGSTGGNAIILSPAGGITLASTFTGASTTETVNAPLLLAGTATFTANSALTNSLSIGGTISGMTGSTAALTLTGTNTGTSTISGAISDGGATGGLALSKTGGDTWVLSNNGNSFSGAVSIGAGSLSVASIGNAGSNSALGTSGTISFGSASNSGGLVYTGSGETSNKVINLAGTSGGATLDDEGTGALKFTSNLTVTGSGTKTINLKGSTSGTGEISGVIADSATGPTLISKSGTGTWILSGNNTYSGTTTVSGGVLDINSSGTSSTNSAIGTGAFTISNGSFDATAGPIDLSTTTNNAVNLNSSFTYLGSNNFNFGTGAVAMGVSSSLRTYTVNANTLTFGGAVTSSSTAAAPAIAVNGPGKLVFGSTFALNADTGTWTTTISGTNGNLTINGAITSPGGGGNDAITFGASGRETITATLNGNNTYNGLTTVFGDGTAGATLNLNGASTGTGGVTVDQNATLNINNAGTSSTNSALGTGTLTLAGGTIDAATSAIDLSATTKNNVAITGDFAFGGSHNLSFGADTATVAFTSGARTVTLGGTNSTLTFGTVSEGNVAGQDTLTVNGAGNTLAISTLKLNSNAAAQTNVIAGSGNVTVSSGITTGGSAADNLTYGGTGTLSVGGTSSYTGSTTVASGHMVLLGTLNAGSAVTVGTGSAVAYLAGTGTVSGSLATVSSGSNMAHIAPGTTPGTVGTLHVGSLGFTIGDDTALDFDLNSSTAVGGSTNDLIAIAAGGTLTFGGVTTINFDALSALSLTGTYTLINGATGGITGFNAANFISTGLASGTTATYSVTGSTLLVSFSNGASPGTYYYTGAHSTDFTDFTNFNTTASGGTQQTAALSSSSDVFIGSTSPTPSNTNPVVNSNLGINSLTFTSSGAGATLSGTGSVTLGASAGVGITDNAGGTTTETISAPLVLGADQKWTVTNSGNTLAVTGAVSGSHALTLTGAGKFNLASDNTYTGGTTVGTGSDSPTLLVSNGHASAGSATGTGSFTLKTGATLLGDGAIRASTFALSGNVIVGNGTDSTSQLTVTGSTASTITSANLAFNLNTTNNTQSNTLDVGSTQISFSGTTLTLNLQGGTVIGENTSYTLVDGLSNSQYSGFTTFTNTAGLLEIQSGGGLNFTFGTSLANTYYNGSYLYLNNGDIDVEVVPEPSTWGMIIAGVALLMFWQRRRRNS